MEISRLSKRTWLLPVLAVAVALTAVGCSRSKTDAQLSSEVQNKISASIPNQPIAVDARDGVVTLSGTIDTEADRLAAAQEAAKVEGVKVVVNNLEVAPAAAAMPEAPAEEPAPAAKPSPYHATPRRTRVARREASPRPASPVASETPAAAPAPRSAEPVPVRATVEHVTIPQGTMLSVRMIDGIDTGKNQLGDTFRASLESPITVDGEVAVPRGTEVEGRLAELKSGGRFAGRSELALELIRLDMNGKSYAIDTDQWTAQGRSEGKRTAATIGGGAALGAIIGAIAGGGKGAAIGTVAGAGAGTGVSAATKGKQVKVDPEAVLQFRLQSPVTVVTSRNREPERQRLQENE